MSRSAPVPQSDAQMWTEQLEKFDQTDAPRSTRVVPISDIIDVSRSRLTRSHRVLSLCGDVAWAVLLVLAVPLVVIAMALPLVWLVRAAAGAVDLL